jgi:tetratricopeptide (TPR) repeat protein
MEQSTTLPSQQLDLPANGILRLYNQFPRCYEDIYQMALQLPEIAAMGFNAVWINPIQETGKLKHPLRQDPLNIGKNNAAYSGSLYATKDNYKIDDFFSTDKHHNSKNNQHDLIALKNYNKIAKEHGLTPIFDLVLNQVALDADIYKQHSEWFKHPSAHFGDFCCDFDYTNLKFRSPIMAFLKEEIRKYIVDYGFMGVRIDAAKHLPLDVQKEIYDYINELCLLHHKVKPIIYAEIIAGEKELPQLCHDMQNLGITHVMNSLFQERFTLDYRRVDLEDGHGYWEKGPTGGKNVLYGLSLLRKLGGTIGFPGSHDYSSLYDAAISDQARSIIEKEYDYGYPIPKFWDIHDAKVLELKKLPLEQQILFLKEKLSAIAFTSDAGWYLLSGDEFGHPGRKWVFDFYNPCEDGKYSFQNGWGGQFDLRPFINGINQILAMLPVPDPNFWVQHVVLKSKPELMIAIRHNGEGFNKTSEVVIINLSNMQLELSLEDIVEISKIVSLRPEDTLEKIKAEKSITNAVNEGKIFCLGDIKFNGLELIKNVRSANVSFMSPPLLKYYMQIAEQDPTNPIAHYYLGNAALDIKNKDLAQKALLNSLELFKKDFPNNPKLIFRLAYSLNLVGCKEQALQCYKQLVSLDQLNPLAHYYLGKAALDIGNNEMAQEKLLQSYELYLKFPPQYPEVLYDLAYAFYKCNLPKKCFECYTTIVTLFPNDPNARYHAGIEYFLNKQPELAQKEFIASLDLFKKASPQTSKPLYLLADEFFKCGLINQAIDCYITAANVFPNDPTVHYNVGQFALRIGNTGLARAGFLKSYELFIIDQQSNIKQLHMLSVALNQVGCLPQALECCKKVVSLNFDNPVAHYNVGIAALAVGQQDLAQKALLQSFELFKQYPPQDANQYKALAGAFQAAKLEDKAMQCLQQAKKMEQQQKITPSPIALKEAPQQIIPKGSFH